MSLLNKSNIINLNNKQQPAVKPSLSKGLYSWMMFLINLYNRVKKDLSIDFDSFIIMQLVVSDYLYKTNKNSSKNFVELEKELQEEAIIKNNFKFKKLNFASIAQVLNLPRETVRRKILNLSNKNILQYDSKGITLGSEYNNIFKKFVSQSLDEMSLLMKKSKQDGSLDKMLNYNE